MSDISIHVENLSKLYPIGAQPRHDTLRGAIPDLTKPSPQSQIPNRQSEDLWALNGVFLEIAAWPVAESET